MMSCLARVQGSRVAFSNLHYYVYLRSGGEGSKRTKRGGGVVGRAAAEQAPAPAPAANRKEEAHVLRGVTGVVSPGQIMAIMGERVQLIDSLDLCVFSFYDARHLL